MGIAKSSTVGSSITSDQSTAGARGATRNAVNSRFMVSEKFNGQINRCALASAGRIGLKAAIHHSFSYEQALHRYSKVMPFHALNYRWVVAFGIIPRSLSHLFSMNDIGAIGPLLVYRELDSKRPATAGCDEKPTDNTKKHPARRPQARC